MTIENTIKSRKIGIGKLRRLRVGRRCDELYAPTHNQMIEEVRRMNYKLVHNRPVHSVIVHRHVSGAGCEDNEHWLFKPKRKGTQ